RNSICRSGDLTSWFYDSRQRRGGNAGSAKYPIPSALAARVLSSTATPELVLAPKEGSGGDRFAVKLKAFCTSSSHNQPGGFSVALRSYPSAKYVGSSKSFIDVGKSLFISILSASSFCSKILRECSRQVNGLQKIPKEGYRLFRA